MLWRRGKIVSSNKSVNAIHKCNAHIASDGVIDKHVCIPLPKVERWNPRIQISLNVKCKILALSQQLVMRQTTVVQNCLAVPNKR